MHYFNYFHADKALCLSLRKYLDSLYKAPTSNCTRMIAHRRYTVAYLHKLSMLVIAKEKDVRNEYNSIKSATHSNVWKPMIHHFLQMLRVWELKFLSRANSTSYLCICICRITSEYSAKPYKPPPPFVSPEKPDEIMLNSDPWCNREKIIKKKPFAIK